MSPMSCTMRKTKRKSAALAAVINLTTAARRTTAQPIPTCLPWERKALAGFAFARTIDREHDRSREKNALGHGCGHFFAPDFNNRISWLPWTTFISQIF